MCKGGTVICHGDMIPSRKKGRIRVSCAFLPFFHIASIFPICYNAFTMKIEMVNENQIRCTITASELIERHLKPSELAFGTENAKLLFRDMMAQAQEEFGFEVENTPLMIEAVPASPNSVVLYITKITSPEGMEDRMPRFASSLSSAYPGPKPLDTVDDMDHSTLKNVKIYVFSDLDVVIRVAHVLKGLYNGTNSLYKEEDSGDYLLVITRDPNHSTDFLKICHMLTEYGVQNGSTGASLAYLEEHCKCIINAHALQTLSEL